MTVAEMEQSMSYEEFISWNAYYGYKAELEKKAIKEANTKRNKL
jgi:hypothetical protein